MTATGWRQLYEDWSWLRGENRFPIPAYSEYMPPPRIGQKPYGPWEIETPFAQDDPWGMTITAAEQERELNPGMALIGRQLVDAVAALMTGRGAHRIGRYHLENNPYWPKTLAERAGALSHEHFLFLSPLALSKTQDDKGRVRWTLFGASHTGPARGFWNSFFRAPSDEIPENDAHAVIRHLLQTVFADAEISDLRASGFRVLPTGRLPEFPDLEDGPLPSWTRPFQLGEADSLEEVCYLLTFRPFALLPERIQNAYVAGQLHLLPCPASLVFWGSPHYRKLEAELPLARQILLLQAVARHANPRGIRVPQSGWLHSATQAHDAGLGAAGSTFRRTHRWQRMHRDEDSSAFSREDRLHKVLFSSHPDDVGLYGKPMARNAHIWSNDFRLVLDGPRANAESIGQAISAMNGGRSFGYRFFYPPMQASRYALFWHRPLVAFRDPRAGEFRTVANGLTGYVTAEGDAGFELADFALWPRLAANAPPAMQAVPDNHDDAVAPNGSGRSYAARMNRVLAQFARHLDVPQTEQFSAHDALTFRSTASRGFEVRYWKTIAKLAEGLYLNKNSADCSQDPKTLERIPWPKRDLDQLGDFLIDHYRRLARGTEALVGAMPFRWQTDFDFRWMEGWLLNQTGRSLERNIVAVIPGRTRNQAIVMADHYDTAYMEDVYGYRKGTNDGARLSASGADDNHSATAALMLGAEYFLELSRQGKLERDIWLVHLTGEEFPSDCLGARNLAQMLVEGRCRMETADGQVVDLSQTVIQGLYVLDMIAHNNERRRDIFQIAPGSDRQSLWLAYQAHAAARMWEEGTARWNKKPQRQGLGRGRRSPHGNATPLVARHLAPRGEVRFHDDPRSTLFNTDGQIFSDAGVPAVLFMENYDINRDGYHDTQDTMANIDLDYGAAVAAIAIEAVARAATQPLPKELFPA